MQLSKGAAMRARFLLIFLVITTVLSASAKTPSIPVLDMRDYENPQTRARFIRQLKNAAQEVGFFALLNFGVEDPLLQATFKSAEAFFRLDMETKMRYCIRELTSLRGYVPGEAAKGEARADYKEFFSIGREASINNIWPKEINLKASLATLYTEIGVKRRRLEEAFAEALGQPKELLTKMTKEGESLLRLFHYPERPPQGCFWAAPHTDINLFTIFFRAKGEGLQLKTKEDEWIEVVVPEKAVIIGCGDMLENLTNGLFRSAIHRVHDGGKGIERFSIAYYTHGSYNDSLDPLPRCIEMTGGKAKYAKATARELLNERLVDLGLATDEVIQELAKSGLMQRLQEVGRASPEAIAALKKAGLLKESDSKAE